MEKEILDLLKSMNIEIKAINTRLTSLEKQLSVLSATSIETKIDVNDIKEKIRNDSLVLNDVKKTIDSNLKVKWF